MGVPLSDTARRLVMVEKMTSSPSRLIQSTVECGLPSGLTVVTTT